MSPFGVKFAAKKLGDAPGFLGSAVEPTGLPQGTVYDVTGQIIRGALTAVGMVFFILMIYGGFLWMTARGNEEQVTKARNMIIAAIIGVAVIVGAYALTNFFTGAVVRSQTGGSDPSELRQ